MKKILIFIIMVTIIAGLVVIFTAGFNFDILTKEHQQIQLSIGEEYNSGELKKVVEDALGQGVEVQKNKDFEDQAIISAKEIPSEKIQDIVAKVNEKYGTEINGETVTIKDIPGIRLIDLLTPYAVSLIVSGIAVLIYVTLRYKTESWIKIALKTIGNIAIAELLAFSIFAIIRIPVGYNIASVIFVVYTLAVLGTTICFEKKFQSSKLEEKTKENKE